MPPTIEPTFILGGIFTALGTVVWFMIRNWAKSWETRLIAQDRRLNLHEERHAKHDTKHAVLETELAHIRADTTETRADVKKLLGAVNGQRSRGG